MIVFYTQTKKETPVYQIKTTTKTTTCNAVCTSNCIKPKNKCCNKYQKKGVNCKRCPLTYDFKAVS